MNSTNSRVAHLAKFDPACFLAFFASVLMAVTLRLRLSTEATAHLEAVLDENLLLNLKFQNLQAAQNVAERELALLLKLIERLRKRFGDMVGGKERALCRLFVARCLFVMLVTKVLRIHD